MLPPMTSTVTSRFSLADHLEHARRVPVCGVDDDDVDAGFDERAGSLVGVFAGADRGGHEQRPAASFEASGNCSRLVKSLTVISPRTRPPPSTSGSFSILCLRNSSRASSSDTPTGAVTSGIGVMTSRTGSRQIGLEPDVAVRDDADKHASCIDDGSTGNPVMRAEAVDVGEGVIGRAGHRVGNHAGLGPLHEVSLRRLLRRSTGCGAGRQRRLASPWRSPCGPRSRCPSRSTAAAPAARCCG